MPSGYPSVSGKAAQLRLYSIEFTHPLDAILCNRCRSAARDLDQLATGMSMLMFLKRASVFRIGSATSAGESAAVATW
jgi:hypothetical protein